jgi:hypothetical protein
MHSEFFAETGPPGVAERFQERVGVVRERERHVEALVDAEER